MHTVRPGAASRWPRPRSHASHQHAARPTWPVVALAAAAAAVVLVAVPVPGSGHPAAGASPSRATSGPATGADPAARAVRDRRPNILLITTDDQRDDELSVMPRTRRLLARRGVDVVDFVSPHPLCCPARAEIMTGEYAHNNGVRHNGGPFGGWEAFLANHDAPHQIGRWLHDAGYRTAFVGKTLNGFVRDQRQLRGWDHWNPSTFGTYSYTHTRFWNDGHPRRPRDYVTDVVARDTHRYLRSFTSGRRPWFLWTSHVAPHNASQPPEISLPPIPAERHAHMFAHAVPPSLAKESFNEADTSDKPPTVQRRNPRPVRQIKTWYRARVRSLQAVDEAVAAAVGQLRRAGQLDRTIIVFTSDNGYLLGEHRLRAKNFPYTEDLQVPFLIRGPGLPHGTRLSGQQISMVDLAATFLARAGILEQVRATGHVDGLDLWPVLRGRATGPDTQLIQAGTSFDRPLAAYGWWWRGVLTAGWTYAYWWNGVQELYDNQADPLQLQNLAADPLYQPVLDELARRLAALSECQGVEQCRVSFGPVPPPLRESRRPR